MIKVYNSYASYALEKNQYFPGGEGTVKKNIQDYDLCIIMDDYMNAWILAINDKEIKLSVNGESQPSTNENQSSTFLLPFTVSFNSITESSKILNEEPVDGLY